MLLVIDVGNTEIAIGLYVDEGPGGRWRLATKSSQTADEIACQISNLLDFSGHKISEISGICLASVVPAATMSIIEMAANYIKVEPLVVDSSCNTGLSIDFEQPESVGGDRIANAVGGHAKYGAPLIVVDFGTATTFDVISGQGAYIGGAIAPGLATSAKALFKSAAMLRGVVLENPNRFIGNTTEDSLKSGLIYGAASMVDGMVAGIKKEMQGEVGVVATGGLAGLVAHHCLSIDDIEPFLTLSGLKKSWDLN